MLSYRLVACVLAGSAIAPLAACSDGTGLLGKVGLAPDPNRREPAAPGFVRDSRTEDRAYMPVGVDAPRRTKPRTGPAKEDLEADLEGARRRNESRGNAATGASKAVGKDLSAPGPLPAG